MFSTPKTILTGSLLAVALLALPVISTAQQPGRQPGMMWDHMMGRGMGCPMMEHGMSMGDMPMMRMGRDMMMHGPMTEARLAYLKAELGITEAQTAAWNGYVTAVKARMTAMQGTHQTMMDAMRSGSATARMDAHAKAMESMVETLKTLKPATEALYAVLTPDQKVKADLMLGMGCCMM